MARHSFSHYSGPQALDLWSRPSPRRLWRATSRPRPTFPARGPIRTRRIHSISWATPRRPPRRCPMSCQGPASIPALSRRPSSIQAESYRASTATPAFANSAMPCAQRRCRLILLSQIDMVLGTIGSITGQSNFAPAATGSLARSGRLLRCASRTCTPRACAAALVLSRPSPARRGPRARRRRRSRSGGRCGLDVAGFDAAAPALVADSIRSLRVQESLRTLLQRRARREVQGVRRR